MDIRYGQDAGAHIVYDAERLDHPSSELFEPAYWRARSALVGHAGGRGTTWFLCQGAEQWALRHYYRGGLVARLLKDRYLWCGLERTRAWREWHLMAELHRRGLPVPAPVAARVIRYGLSYSADLITQRIPDVEPLSLRLQTVPLPCEDWQRLGYVLRRFHDAGLDHADLNAHNILLGTSRQFWLIDFDKGRLRSAGGYWRTNNLRRLLRSLRKLRRLSPSFRCSESDWDALLSGYEAAGSTLTGR
jgi:3-deoxy-D-manno-octulosonic acid kinase